MSVSPFLLSFGIPGIVIAIILMMAICTTPIPSEGILIVYLKIYGVWWGSLYAWVSAVLSSLIVFSVSRRFGTALLHSLITKQRVDQVDQWIEKRGTIGLLFMRLLPLPGFIVSYVVGTIPSVRLGTYVWTGAVSLIRCIDDVPWRVSTICLLYRHRRGRLIPFLAMWVCFEEEVAVMLRLVPDIWRWRGSRCISRFICAIGTPLVRFTYQISLSLYLFTMF